MLLLAMEEITTFAVRTGWWAMMAGVVSGAIIGLFFQREDWMGGYSSYRRRLTRLGHISFFGFGFIKLAGRLYHPRFVAQRTRQFKSHGRNRIKDEIQAKHAAAASAA